MVFETLRDCRKSLFCQKCALQLLKLDHHKMAILGFFDSLHRSKPVRERKGMSEITLEKVHGLLTDLAEYVMNEVPTRREVVTKEEFQRAISGLQIQLDQKADRSEVAEIKEGMNRLLEGMDAMVGELQTIRIEQVSIDASLRQVERRVDVLEKSAST